MKIGCTAFLLPVSRETSHLCETIPLGRFATFLFGKSCFSRILSSSLFLLYLIIASVDSLFFISDLVDDASFAPFCISKGVFVRFGEHDESSSKKILKAPPTFHRQVSKTLFMKTCLLDEIQEIPSGPSSHERIQVDYQRSGIVSESNATLMPCNLFKSFCVE